MTAGLTSACVSRSQRGTRVHSCEHNILNGEGVQFDPLLLILGSYMRPAVGVYEPTRHLDTGLLLPNNQRQHRTSHAPTDVLHLRIRGRCLAT
jgi:hypothetical protein